MAWAMMVRNERYKEPAALADCAIGGRVGSGLSETNAPAAKEPKALESSG
jgi:hypothetical protein